MAGTVAVPQRAKRSDAARGWLLDVERVYKAYPHQLACGELHRIAIAQALVCRPKLVDCGRAYAFFGCDRAG